MRNADVTMETGAPTVPAPAGRERPPISVRRFSPRRLLALPVSPAEAPS